jgi:hypothetical protein
MQQLDRAGFCLPRLFASALMAGKDHSPSSGDLEKE